MIFLSGSFFCCRGFFNERLEENVATLFLKDNGPLFEA
jgi:hypothetical protein